MLPAYLQVDAQGKKTDITHIQCHADIPGGLAVKKFGFWVVPAATVSFGIVTLCTGFIHNRGSFFTMRLLLGITERWALFLPHAWASGSTWLICQR